MVSLQYDLFKTLAYLMTFQVLFLQKYFVTIVTGENRKAKFKTKGSFTGEDTGERLAIWFLPSMDSFENSYYDAEVAIETIYI